MQDGRKCRDAFLAVGVYDGGCFVIGLVHVETDGKCRLELSMVSTSFGCFSWYIVEWAEAEEMVRTYVDRIIGYVWTVFGLSAFLLSCVAVFWWDIPILFTILLLMGMGTALTGLIVGMKVVTVGGVLGALLSLGCFFIPGISQMLFFALAFVFMMVIPGHMMNRMASRNKKGIAYV